MKYYGEKSVVHIIDLVVSDKTIKHTGKAIKKRLKALPGEDVAEVKHGCWKRQKGRPEAICSECGREVVYQTIGNKWWFENYCPHCGAKMDKKEGSNNG